MIQLHSLSQLESATIKAIEKEPALRVIDFGHYEVRGSRERWYTVRCWTDDEGRRFVACTCENLGHRRKGFTCYHMAPAVGAHLLMAVAKKSFNIKIDDDK